MKPLVCFLLLLSLVTAAKCAEPRFVGEINGSDIVLNIHLFNLLLSHGIKAGISGSMGHSIMVPASRAAEAQRLIREDAPKRHYDVWFAKGDQILAHGKPAELLSHRVPFRSVLRLARCSRQTAVGRLLRRQEIADVFAKYPYVDSLEIVERRYFATPTHLRKAYQVNFSLHSLPGPSSAGYESSTYYIGADGQDIRL